MFNNLKLVKDFFKLRLNCSQQSRPLGRLFRAIFDVKVLNWIITQILKCRGIIIPAISKLLKNFYTDMRGILIIVEKLFTKMV